MQKDLQNFCSETDLIIPVKYHLIIPVKYHHIS